MRVLAIEPRVRMKLTSFRDKDRMHVRNLSDVGRRWRLAEPPAAWHASERLQEMLNAPDG